MRSKLLGAALGLSLVFGANSAAFAEESASPVPMSATEITFDGPSARVIAFDQTGNSHVIVLDLSQLSAAERGALESGMQQANQPEMAPNQGESAGLTLPQGENNIVESGINNSTSAAGAYGQPGDAGVTADGHATDSSNNTMGDVSEGLQNQPATSDEDSANGGDQPNAPAT